MWKEMMEGMHGGYTGDFNNLTMDNKSRNRNEKEERILIIETINSYQHRGRRLNATY